MNHNQKLADAFDGQAPKFEKAPVQTDPAALARLLQMADLPAVARILDAGCGPGLVSKALLEAGHQVLGVDLSGEMIERARKRCESFVTAKFLQASVFDEGLNALDRFDAAISRYVLHHVLDPRAFLLRQVELLKPGGILVVSDHLTDPVPELATLHQTIEVMRDKTHTRNLTGGELVDLFASVGLQEIRYVEEPFILDFDEWFDRGTPTEAKNSVRARILSAPAIRGFRHSLQTDGSIRIDCVRSIIRALKPI